MYDNYPKYDVPQQNLIQRFFSQRWSAIIIEIVMTIVITVAAGAAFDFFDPLDGERAASADVTPGERVKEDEVESETRDPLAFARSLGIDYIAAGRMAAAKAIFDWLIKAAPDAGSSYAWRGYVNMQTRQYIEAQADYRRLLERRPADFDGHNALCWAYGESKDFARAKAHCQRALESAVSRGEFASALENRCWLQVEMGDYAAAATDCRLSLSYAPEYGEVNALAHYNLGRVHVARGKTSEALPHFREALRIGSSYAKMYLDIGEVYATLGHQVAAQASFEQYRRLTGGAVLAAHG
ncbi:MAG: tetratricopeptide repeat protein [Chloroflexota bacterium]|nr:tetratricopeptide repeat protein [Chloroflexota bacterium]